MSDVRTRRNSKRALRGAARLRQPRRQPPEESLLEEWPLAEFVRKALAAGHPLNLLGLVSYMIQVAPPDTFGFSKADEQVPVHLSNLVDTFIARRVPETSALLAVLVHLIDDDLLRVRCRKELATRNDALPEWLSGLADVEAVRAVRLTHVLGDEEELLFGVRLAGGYDLTCVVHIDHHTLSEVADAKVIAGTLDEVLADGARQLAHRDYRDYREEDLSLADARAWIAHGLERAELLPEQETDSWPDCRPLLRWLLWSLPEGGSAYEEPLWDSRRTQEMFNQFFTSPSGRRYDDYELRQLLSELCDDTGTGDPLRWSVARLRQILKPPLLHDHYVAAVWLMEVPDLLRDYVPFAHAQSGIRAGLTAQALAAIAELRSAYQRAVLNEPDLWADDTDDDANGALQAALAAIELRYGNRRAM